MDKKPLLELIIKKKSGSITLAEQIQLSQFLEENDCEAYLNIIEEIFESRLNFDDEVSIQSVNASIENVLKKTGIERSETKPLQPQLHKYYRIIAIAASFLLLVLSGYFLFFKSEKSADRENTVATTTSKGSKSYILLPDGSQVWINADTKLTYNKSFGETNREVELSGEAYFDVVKDKLHPFIIHTKDIDLKVLGTAFNVRAYSSEANTQTTLLRGSVEMHLKRQSGRIILLKPNEKIIVKNHDLVAKNSATNYIPEPEIILSKIQKYSVDSSVLETLWIKNKIAFNNDRLDDIAAILERWYGVNIIIDNDHLKEKKLSGIFENKSVDEIMEALQLVAGFKYHIHNDTITITK